MAYTRVQNLLVTTQFFADTLVAYCEFDQLTSSSGLALFCLEALELAPKYCLRECILTNNTGRKNRQHPQKIEGRLKKVFFSRQNSADLREGVG